MSVFLQGFRGHVFTHFNRKVSSVDIVSQEEVSCFGRIAAHFEQFHQVILSETNKRLARANVARLCRFATHILSMNITAD